jgi:hypothetical protein
LLEHAEHISSDEHKMQLAVEHFEHNDDEFNLYPGLQLEHVVPPMQVKQLA